MNSWNDLIRGNIYYNEPLSRHTTFKIGGPADVWVEPADDKDLRAVLDFCRRHKMPFFVIGRGSNILIKDTGLRGVVIHLNNPYFKGIDFHGYFVSAGTGIDLSRLLCLCRNQGLGGAEFLTGIPGTLGGAIMGNAQNIGELIEDVTVMNACGGIETLKKQGLQFAYRSSNLTPYIILGAKLKLEKKDKRDIARTMNECLRHKQETQDLALPSAGSIFKNPEQGKPAGQLIEACGLKGTKINDAQVSTKHANYIVNLAHATAKDVIALMELIRARVQKDHGILLEPEIKIL